MKLSYYPGCSLHSTAKEFDDSTKVVCKALGIELQEVKDWSCCGASSGHAVDPYLNNALPLRNLILAEEQGSDVLVPCASCYQNLKMADYQVKHGDVLSENQDLREIMGRSYGGTIEVRHLLDVFTKKEVADSLRKKAVKQLQGLKVAPYYGCYLVRPSKMVAFDDPEQPETLDRVLRQLGAEVVEWSYKTDCCGGSLTLTKTELVVSLVAKLMTKAQEAGADALVTACPMCMANLDTRQKEALAGDSSLVNHIPVFYVTELMGLAMGVDKTDWWRKHLVDPIPLLREKGVAP